MTPALEVEGLTRSFGGVRAIDALGFTVPAGTVQAIIGPNGAGKTTLVNLITGLYAPDAGTLRVFGQTVNGLPPHERAGLGLARTFQSPQLCMNLSAVDNVMVGAHRQLQTSLLAGLLGMPSLRHADAAARRRAGELMAFVGIDSAQEADAASLSYGTLKRLEIARALAADPRLLLLDEPAAGLNHSETDQLEALIRRIADKGTTVVLIEHDMRLVMSVSDSILVLNYGARLALGSVEMIRDDPAVIEAYLGAQPSPTP